MTRSKDRKKPKRRESMAEVQAKVSRALEAAGIAHSVKSMQAYWTKMSGQLSKRPDYYSDEGPSMFLVGVFVAVKEK